MTIAQLARSLWMTAERISSEDWRRDKLTSTDKDIDDDSRYWERQETYRSLCRRKKLDVLEKERQESLH